MVTSLEARDTGADSRPLSLPGLFVSPQWLLEHLDHPALRLFDVRTGENYQRDHLPHAIHVDLAQLACVRDGVPGMLLDAPAFAVQMGALGVDDNKWVVIYDDNWGMPAARLLWALAHYGHTQAAILRGGWQQWRAANLPRTVQPHRAPVTTFMAQPVAERLAERSWLLQQTGRDDLVVVDTRTALEYSQGHLPGALHWDWLNAVQTNGWEPMRDEAVLRTELAALGITPDKEIVTYCRSGMRAAHTHLVLRVLGYARVRNYDGSWLEWSRYLANAERQ